MIEPGPFDLSPSAAHGPRGLLAALADLVYPVGRSCLWCGGPAVVGGLPFCPDCLAGLVAGGPLEIGPPSGVNRAVAAGVYGGALEEAIHRLKFSGWTFLAPIMGALLSGALAVADLWTADVIVPVPLHPRRFIERGFNQSALLGRAVARAHMGELAADGLLRARATRSQVGLGPADRSLNVRGAFRVRHPGAFLGRRVLLIDDVLTTGSTAGECARGLSDDGAASVDLAVLAVAKVRRNDQ